MKTVSRYPKRRARDGEPRTIRKSVSCEPVLDFSSDDDEDRTGGKDSSNGARLTCGSLTPSPAGKRLFVKKSASEAGRSRPGSSDSFQVGANTDDDVFAEDDESIVSFAGTNDTAANETAVYHEQLTAASIPAVDAQGIYPPTACIFVANLSQLDDDKALEYEVTRAFSQFGPVFVKIRRDNRQMPFAFCQFTTDEDAQTAERVGKGIVILNRPCRTEMARAHSSFIVYKHSGDYINVEEAVELLSCLGEIAKAEELDVGIQSSLRLPPAIVASYKMYDQKRDVPLTFRGDRKYKVIPYDPKSIANPRPSHASPNKEQFLHQYDRDRRSVYMGNLPMEMTEDTLTNLAGACGEVISVVVFKKPVQGNPGKMTCFAFVEFSRPDSADDAIVAFNDKDISGFRVRVDRKHSRTFETPRRGPFMRSSNYSHSTFPRRRHPSIMEPVSPLHTMFDPPVGHVKKIVEAPADGMVSVSPDETPKTAEESTAQGFAADNSSSGGSGNVFTPTPKRLNDAANANTFAYGNMETPMAMPQQHATIPIPWIPPFSPYPYGAPMSPYGPMTPHGTPGVMYPGYSPGPYYPGMYGEMYPMASPPHMMLPQQMAQPMNSEAPMQAAEYATTEPEKEQKD